MIESVERERPFGCAADAHDRGFSVIQLDAPNPAIPNSGKKPVGRWKEAQKLRCSRSEAARITGNYGIVTGLVSGIVIVDVDSEEAMAWVRENLVLPDSYTKTARGVHLPYQHPGVVVPNGAKLQGIPLDVRGDGGFVVGPGSKHWSGKPYEAIGSWDIHSFPVFNPAWIARERKFQPGAPIEESDRVRRIRRAMAYVAKMEPAVSGRGGHNATMRVAGVLVQRFGLTIEEALPIMLQFNERCEPKWSDREILHKLTEAERLKVHQTIGGSS